MTFYDYCKDNDKLGYINNWSPKNDFLPTDVTYGSKQKAIFNCPVCGWEVAKVIHDIRKLKDFHCKECEATEREKRKEEQKKLKEKNKIAKPKKPVAPKKPKKKKLSLEEFEALPIEKKYLMIDVETNGLNAKDDDLLEISIYRPDTNTMFHKYLPLTKQKKVLTGCFNGLTKAKLKDASHLTEKDVEYLIDEFEITQRTLLHYGTLDAPFLKNYFKEHKLPKRSVLKFFNFKKNIISSRFAASEIDGGISKDNLCKMYGIEGVTEIHDCQNDCLLQWELFKRIHDKKILITGKHVYSVPDNSGYLVPSSFLDYSRIQNILKNPLPNIVVDEEVKARFVMGNCLPSIKKEFGPTAVGMMVEHQLNTLLDADFYDNYLLFAENKHKLVYEGTINVNDDNVIPATFNGDGSLTLHDTDKIPKKKIKKLQNITDKELKKLREALMKQFVPCIKKEVFNDKQIYSQEVVINHEDGIISKCDLSNEFGICEIKNTQYHIDYHKYQLWYQQHSEQLEETIAKSEKQRPLYAITICYNVWGDTIATLYKINFLICNDAHHAANISYFKRMN